MRDSKTITRQKRPKRPMILPTLLLLSRDEEIGALVAAAAKAAWRVAQHHETHAADGVFEEPNVRLVILDDEAVDEHDRGRLLTQIRRRVPNAPLLYIAGGHNVITRSGRAPTAPITTFPNPSHSKDSGMFCTLSCGSISPPSLNARPEPVDISPAPRLLGWSGWLHPDPIRSKRMGHPQSQWARPARESPGRGGRGFPSMGSARLGRAFISDGSGALDVAARHRQWLPRATRGSNRGPAFFSCARLSAASFRIGANLSVRVHGPRRLIRFL